MQVEMRTAPPEEHLPGEERVAASLEASHGIVDIHQLEERSLL